MEDVTRDPDDPDAWMWWRDDEDAPRDATKKARQMLFLIRDSSLITLFSTTSSSPQTNLLAPLHVASVSSISPSPFAAPSRASTSKPREENVHTATIANIAKSSHALLSREDESQANSRDATPQRDNTSGDIGTHAVGTDLNQVQDPIQVCPNSKFSCVRAHIHSPCNRVRLPRASDDSRIQQMQRQAIRQGFCYEEPATGAHGLLANLSAAAEPTSLVDSGASATTSDDPGPSPSLQQQSDMDLDLDVSMGLADSDVDAEGVTDDEVVVPSPTPSAPHPLLRPSGAHEHPDGPMLGFIVPERGVADADASTSLDHARVSPDRGLDFDLTSLTSLGPSVSGGEGWADWPTRHGLGGASLSPDTGVSEYAGDGTIDPSVLGGGGGCQPQQGIRIRKLARWSSCGSLSRDGRRMSYG